MSDEPTGVSAPTAPRRVHRDRGGLVLVAFAAVALLFIVLPLVALLTQVRWSSLARDLSTAGAREALLRDQIDRADALYDHGIAGIELLPRGRRAIAAAAGMYREILRQIEREGYGARPGRAVVAPRRKLAVAARRAALLR